MQVLNPFRDAKSLPKTPIKLKPAPGERLAERSKSALMDKLEALLQQLLVASSYSPPYCRWKVSSGCLGFCYSVYP